MPDWLTWDWLTWDFFTSRSFLFGAVISVGLFVFSLTVTVVVIVRLPEDHFVNHESRGRSNGSRAVRIGKAIARNLLGLLLVGLGVLLSVPGVPGQGLLTILMGLMLLDLPPVRRLEKWLVRRPSVRDGINRLRSRFGRPPIRVDDDGEPPA